MQTFLPYPDFVKTAKCLDNRRLGKQRVECLQILQVLTNPKSKAWVNHPAVKMWRGYESALADYGMTICEEWRSRGFKDSCYDKIRKYLKWPIKYPKWLGNKEFHSSHRSNLLRKDSKHYGMFGWIETNDQNYVWPVESYEQNI